jgi:hypothetical protein
MTAQHLPKLKTNLAQWPVLRAVGQLYNFPESYFERLMDLKNKVHLKSLKLQLLSLENFVRHPVDLSPGVLEARNVPVMGIFTVLNLCHDAGGFFWVRGWWQQIVDAERQFQAFFDDKIVAILHSRFWE